MSDGLTVPFALAAGLSGAVSSSHIVVTAGLAEVAAGSIAMGLGGFLAARSDAEHYASELAREQNEIETVPEIEAAEVRGIFETYGLNPDESASAVDGLRRRKSSWLDFMMRFELGLERPDPKWKADPAGAQGSAVVSRVQSGETAGPGSGRPPVGSRRGQSGGGSVGRTRCGGDPVFSSSIS